MQLLPAPIMPTSTMDLPGAMPVAFIPLTYGHNLGSQSGMRPAPPLNLPSIITRVSPHIRRSIYESCVSDNITNGFSDSSNHAGVTIHHPVDPCTSGTGRIARADLGHPTPDRDDRETHFP